MQEECIDENYYIKNVKECNNIMDNWIDDYNHYRPHKSINDLTPVEYCAELNITIPKVAALGNM